MFLHPLLFLLRKKNTDRCFCIIFVSQLINFHRILLIHNGHCHIQFTEQILPFLCSAQIKKLLADLFDRSDTRVRRNHIIGTYKPIDLLFIKYPGTFRKIRIIFNLNIGTVSGFPLFQCCSHTLITFERTDLLATV